MQGKNAHFTLAFFPILLKKKYFWNSYSEKILKLSDNAFERCKSTVIRDDEEFNVLNHGDFWTNNMMFRYDEDHKPVDFKFVSCIISQQKQKKKRCIKILC